MVYNKKFRSTGAEPVPCQSFKRKQKELKNPVIQIKDINSAARESNQYRLIVKLVSVANLFVLRQKDLEPKDLSFDESAEGDKFKLEESEYQQIVGEKPQYNFTRIF